MTKIDKWKRLDELALQDETYCHYKNRYNECAVKFGRFMRWCPPKIRDLLCDYADCGRLMMLRMAGIALENMEFNDDK